jgi:hypothetical protein
MLTSENGTSPFDAAMNASIKAGNNYHVFCEYADGSRGYYAGRKTLAAAIALADKLDDPTIYDNAGNDAEDTPASRNVD